MTKPYRKALTEAEVRARKLAAQHVFATRMLLAVGLWCAITAFGLIVGVAGYAYFEDLSLTDSFVNAAMILSGMGPVLITFKTESGKVFAGCYAIFSGLVIVIATGFVLAPIFHHVLHKFHVETSKDN
jgi:hypothetical protein